jgi:hypothetical protein
MLRNGLAALAGVIGAVVLTMVLQFVAHTIAPPSREMMEAFQKITSDDPATVEQAREMFAGELGKHPLQLVLVIVSHALGTFFGALTAVRVAREAHIVPASIVGSLMLLGGISNVLLIPHPAWFNAIDLLLYIPAALFAWRLAADPTSDSLTPGDEDHGPQSAEMTPVES